MYALVLGIVGVALVALGNHQVELLQQLPQQLVVVAVVAAEKKTQNKCSYLTKEYA